MRQRGTNCALLLLCLQGWLEGNIALASVLENVLSQIINHE